MRCREKPGYRVRPDDKFRVSFTLIELLVVVAIIAILAALLLPGLRGARDRGRIVLCMSNQRQMMAAFTSYAGDFEEYPTNYGRGIAPSWNWGDECAGRMFGAPPERTSWDYNTAPFFYPNRTVDVPGWPTWAMGAGHRLLASGYLPDRLPPGRSPYSTAIQPWGSAVFMCSGQLPVGWIWGGRTDGVYVYNGPHSHKNTIGNNSAKSGLRFLGRHHQGEDWGPSFRYSPAVYSPSEIAFMGCPSVYNTDIAHVREPHGFQPSRSYVDTGYSNGQDDWGWSNYDELHYDRNYLFGDGHVRYLHARSRADIP